MSLKYKHTCDRCGKSEEVLPGEDPGMQILHIRLTVTYNSPSMYDNPLFSEQWCRACAVQVGVFRPRIEEDHNVLATAKTPPVQTIEEFIREIVREEMEVRG